jgi:putative flippase GtrA
MRGLLSRELRSFVAIGVLCTAAYAALYTLLRGASVPTQLANAAALAATIGLNFGANRRYTFRATDDPMLPQLAGYAVAYMLGVAASGALLAALGRGDTLTALAASSAATIVRYVLMRTWVFRAALRRPAAPRQAALSYAPTRR